MTRARVGFQPSPFVLSRRVKTMQNLDGENNTVSEAAKLKPDPRTEGKGTTREYSPTTPYYSEARDGIG